MSKQVLFKKTVTAMDNYGKALDKKVKCEIAPLCFIYSKFENYYSRRIDKYYREIKEKGWYDEFIEYALVF